MARFDNRGGNTRSTSSMPRPFKCKCGKTYAVEWALDVHRGMCKHGKQ